MEISKAQKSDIPEILALQKAAFLPIAAVREGTIPPVFFCGRIGQKIGSRGYLLLENKEV